MHIHYFQHDHFEDLDYIGKWAGSHNFTSSCTRFDTNPQFPEHHSYDWLIVMGGKMSVNDAERLHWIETEIEFIAKAIRLGKTVIGICLGSQLVAKALGAKVYKNSEPEMGFWPVSFNYDAGKDDVFRHFPSTLSVMHMHFDIFDLPVGAIPMASSEVTPVQAFRFGKNVFAFQFHFELTPESATGFVREVSTEIIPGRRVQYPQEILRHIHYCQNNNLIFGKVLDEIATQRIPERKENAQSPDN